MIRATGGFSAVMAPATANSPPVIVPAPTITCRRIARRGGINHPLLIPIQHDVEGGRVCNHVVHRQAQVAAGLVCAGTVPDGLDACSRWPARWDASGPIMPGSSLSTSGAIAPAWSARNTNRSVESVGKEIRWAD